MTASSEFSPTIAGEVTAAEAWTRLVQDPAARLIDVRSQAEWTFVGLPDLSSLGRAPVLVSWQTFPGMVRNLDFIDHLRGQGVKADEPLLLLCRSGVRSLAAARHLAGLGFTECWNIGDGFEGGLDEHGHRGTLGGWKAAGLPWTQG